MKISRDHVLHGVQFIASPNCDERPVESDISAIVLHAISLPSGDFGTPHIQALFTNSIDTSAHVSFASLEGLRVSSHLFITRRGRVLQFVPFNKRAWHAGVSTYRGRTNCNDFSIGIELEGTAKHRFTKLQYEKLARVVRALIDHYSGLSASRIAGHSEISRGRKWDPGPTFDWNRLMRLIHSAN